MTERLILFSLIGLMFLILIFQWGYRNGYKQGDKERQESDTIKRIKKRILERGSNAR